MIIKNIESKIRLATWISIGSFITAIIICMAVSFFAYRQVANARQSIYILDNGIPILARQTDMEMNRPAEYRAAVDLFHSLFFQAYQSMLGLLRLGNRYGKERLEAACKRALAGNVYNYVTIAKILGNNMDMEEGNGSTTDYRPPGNPNARGAETFKKRFEEN